MGIVGLRAVTLVKYADTELDVVVLGTAGRMEDGLDLIPNTLSIDLVVAAAVVVDDGGGVGIDGGSVCVGGGGELVGLRIWGGLVLALTMISDPENT